jgi:hypothetical protein
MGYRSSLEAANAHIEALEHEIHDLRAEAERRDAAEARAELAHAREVASQPPTARERELTRELEVAHRRMAGMAGPIAPRRGMWPTLAAIAVGVAVVLAFSLVAAVHTTTRPRMAVAAPVAARPIVAAAAPVPPPMPVAADPASWCIGR